MSDAPDLPNRRQRALITREKLLSAAREEFQRHGFAGARIDAIAAGAGMNKRLIYVHFGDKEGLFDAVVTRNLEAVVHDVPFDAADLPGYAVRLFDYWSEHPEAARLFWWRNLERSATTEVEEAAYRGMIDQIAPADDGPNSHALPPSHLFAFILGLLQAWAIPSGSLDPAGAATEHGLRRKSVREAAERLVLHR